MLKAKLKGNYNDGKGYVETAHSLSYRRIFRAMRRLVSVANYLDHKAAPPLFYSEETGEWKLPICRPGRRYMLSMNIDMDSYDEWDISIWRVENTRYMLGGRKSRSKMKARALRLLPPNEREFEE